MLNITDSEMPTEAPESQPMASPVFPSCAGQEAVDRLHCRAAQILVALIRVGLHFGFRSLIPQALHTITYEGEKLGDMMGVLASLDSEAQMSPSVEVVEGAFVIDCIWFKNGRLMPAVIEIEHATGVTSALTRMDRLRRISPQYPTRWVIAAPDEDRERVLAECNREQFRDLNAMYFPYSAIGELYSLCQRRKISGVSERFLDSFMESTLRPN